jgi:hypothetical protein
MGMKIFLGEKEKHLPRVLIEAFDDHIRIQPSRRGFGQGSGLVKDEVPHLCQVTPEAVSPHEHAEFPHLEIHFFIDERKGDSNGTGAGHHEDRYEDLQRPRDVTTFDPPTDEPGYGNGNDHEQVPLENGSTVGALVRLG